MIPESVRRFLLTSIPSVPHLEALLLFHDSPRRTRSTQEVARALYVPESTAESVLEYLASIRCVAPAEDGEPAFRYAPADDEMALLLGEVARVYRADMIGVTHLIHDATAKNARRFADAFKLKKDR